MSCFDALGTTHNSSVRSKVAASAAVFGEKALNSPPNTYAITNHIIHPHITCYGKNSNMLGEYILAKLGEKILKTGLIYHFMIENLT